MVAFVGVGFLAHILTGVGFVYLGGCFGLIQTQFPEEFLRISRAIHVDLLFVSHQESLI